MLHAGILRGLARLADAPDLQSAGYPDRSPGDGRWTAILSGGLHVHQGDRQLSMAGTRREHRRSDGACLTLMADPAPSSPVPRQFRRLGLGTALMFLLAGICILMAALVHESWQRTSTKNAN